MTKEQPQQAINRLWSDRSANYDRIIHDELSSFRAAAWKERISDQVGGRSGLDVLDCGCGPAFFTILLAQLGHHVTGIDAAPGMLEHARRNIQEYGVTARILEMDCHSLELPDESFDLVLSRNLTHALRDPVAVYREWMRVLRPGGTLLIFDANWHLPYASEEMYRESMQREKKGIEVFGSDFSGNTVFDEKAEFPEKRVPKQHPFGDRIRPDWDCGALCALGFGEVSFERDITEKLWDDKEKLIYGNTPMFMIRAVR